MSIKNSNENFLQEHSKAKIRLYEEYLKAYLGVLSQVPGIPTIKIYDLFAGEGKYGSDKGSPLVTIETIEKQLRIKPDSFNQIDILFNDSEKSEYEPEVYKIDRVKKFIETEFPNLPIVNLRFCKQDYGVIIKDVIQELISMSKYSRALIFIDPWGYREIEVADLTSLLQNNKADLILFIPINHMYRFQEKSLQDSDYSGGQRIRRFLFSIGVAESEKFTDQVKFIDRIRDGLKSTTGIKHMDSFRIDAGNNHLYAIYFFTNNDRAFEKMINAKWILDEHEGRGFKISQTGHLFSPQEETGFENSLWKYLIEERNNIDIYHFTLFEYGHPAKHAYELLNQWENENKLIIISDDRKKGSFYIDSKPKKIIQVKRKQNG